MERMGKVVALRVVGYERAQYPIIVIDEGHEIDKF